MKYKVGDKVKIVNDKSHHRFPIGSVVTINHIDDGAVEGKHGISATDGVRTRYVSNGIEAIPSRMKVLRTEVRLAHPTNPRITLSVKRSKCRHYLVTAFKDGKQDRAYKRTTLRHLMDKGYVSHSLAV